jgi:hypothetical protein
MNATTTNRTRNRLAGLSLGIMPLMLAGCDDSLSSSEIIDIIFAAGEVVLAILSMVL